MLVRQFSHALSIQIQYNSTPEETLSMYTLFWEHSALLQKVMHFFKLKFACGTEKFPAVCSNC